MIGKIVSVALAAALAAGQIPAADMLESTDNYGPFGALHIYQTSEYPGNVVLLISGDGGWNLGVIDMARSLAELDSMVVGIDITHYIKQLNASNEKCVYAAAQFENLSQYLQKKLSFPGYRPPVLVGYSSGATMVYATLAQSPANTFAGGISMGFCPDLDTARPFCKGNGTLASKPDPKLGFIYQTVSRLPSPWMVLQGEIDQVCSTPDTKAFAAKVAGAELVPLPKVGHGFSVQKNWMPQFRDSFQKIIAQQNQDAPPAPNAAAVSDLPLIELPAAGKSNVLAIVISGDGGWASIDKQIGETLRNDGVSVVGLNSLKYFWSKKTPDIAGKDLTRILSFYGHAWDADTFILVGYSRGADVLPFMTSRLPEELRAKVKTVALLGVEENVDFEFHITDWLSGGGDSAHQTIPEIRKLAGMDVLCIYGSDEKHSACTGLTKNDARVVEMHGGHHFGGDYEKLAAIILQHSKR
jgi:type IV secretory pathway VirJ component